MPRLACLLLLASGADHSVVDKDERTPLLGAARYGHAAVVGLIALHAGNVPGTLCHRDVEGQTALALAARYGHERVAHQLISISMRGENVDVGIEVADDKGNTPLLIAALRGHAAAAEADLLWCRFCGKSYTTPGWLARHEAVCEEVQHAELQGHAGGRGGGRGRGGKRRKLGV